MLHAVQDQKEIWRKAGEKYAKEMSEAVIKRIENMNQNLSMANTALNQSKLQLIHKEKMSEEIIVGRNA